MSAAATPQRAEAAGVRAESRVERMVATSVLLSAFLVLCLFYAWQALSHHSPWLFSDEIEYTQLSRAIAATGHAARRGEPYTFFSLYTYLLAPVWWIRDTQTAYEAAKYLGVFVMTSAIFPAYWLARMLVPRGPAVFAAVATASIPALPYSRLLITEVLAYPYATLCFFLIAKALATWRRHWLALALIAVLVAPSVRRELVILRPVFVLAALIALWLTEPARRFRQRWSWLEWAGALLLGVTLALVAHELAKRHSTYWYTATTLPNRLHDFSVWSAGALTMGLGIFPVVAGLVSLWRPEDARLPAYRAFVGVLAASIGVFVLYTGVKATYLSTVFANVISERNLIYLSPLLFTGTALFLHRPQVNLAVLAAAAALVAYLIVETPFQLDHYPYSDAPGLAILAEGNRTLALDDASIQRVLLWILAGSVAVVLAAWLARRGTPVLRSALSVVALLVIAWNLAGANSFGKGINSLANRLRSTVPEPPNWIDRATGDGPTFYLGEGIADPNPILVTEFFNRSVKDVGSLDETAPGPGPTVTPVPFKADGSVLNDPGVRYVVTLGTAVEVAGTLVERTGDWRLYRLAGPLRLRSAVTGLYPDGWIGAEAGYSRFGSGTRGVLEVLVSRAGWGGPDRPGRVTIRVGRLVPAPIETIKNPCAGGVCVSRQPRIAQVTAVRRWVAHSGKQKVFRISVKTPFRVEIRVSPTFSPREFGLGDARQLGVQLGLAFKPRHPR